MLFLPINFQITLLRLSNVLETLNIDLPFDNDQNYHAISFDAKFVIIK